MKRKPEAEKPTIHPNEVMLVKVATPARKKVTDLPIVEELDLEVMYEVDRKVLRRKQEALADQYRRQTEVLLNG